MDASCIVCTGAQRTIEYAVLADGSMPARDSLESLTPRDKARVLVLFERLAEHGRIASREQFKKVEGTEFWEFKRFQTRVICFFLPKGRVILTNGFIKKRDRIDPSDIAIARDIKDRCLNVQWK